VNVVGTKLSSSYRRDPQSFHPSYFPLSLLVPAVELDIYQDFRLRTWNFPLYPSHWFIFIQLAIKPEVRRFLVVGENDF